jgi:hypothetical protein
MTPEEPQPPDLNVDKFVAHIMSAALAGIGLPREFFTPENPDEISFAE